MPWEKERKETNTKLVGQWKVAPRKLIIFFFKMAATLPKEPHKLKFSLMMQEVTQLLTVCLTSYPI